MMNTTEINGLLSSMSNFFSSNPNLINSDFIYDNILKTYGLTNEEIKNPSLVDQTDRLDMNFSNSAHIDVFTSPLQPSFLQFSNATYDITYEIEKGKEEEFSVKAYQYLANLYKNSNKFCVSFIPNGIKVTLTSQKYLSQVFNSLKDNSVISSRIEPVDVNYMKLYLSVPKEYVGYVAQVVFNYIDSKGMKTASKVSDTVRADEIVIRLKNEEDVRDVLNFINNDRISTLCRSNSPMIFKEGVVGITYDAIPSYNMVISDLLYFYFSFLKQNNMLGNANYESFKEFVNERYTNFFINYSEILDVVNYYQNRGVKAESPGILLANIEEIYRLVNNTLQGKMNLDSYFAFYKDTLNIDRHLQGAVLFDEVIKNKIKPKKDFNETKKIVDNYISYCLQNNMSPHYIGQSLALFINGSYSYIDNNYINIFKELDSSIVHNIVGDNPFNYINMLVDNRVNMVNTVESFKQEDILSPDDSKQVFDQYIIDSLIKYQNPEDVINNIANYFNGKINLIDEEYRSLFMAMDRNYINKLINGSLSNYVNMVIKANVTDEPKKENSSQKYDLLINTAINIASRFGYQQLVVALNMAKHGDYSYFPNAVIMEESIKPEEFEKLCEVYLEQNGYKNVDNIFNAFGQDITNKVLEQRKQMTQ